MKPDNLFIVREIVDVTFRLPWGTNPREWFRSKEFTDPQYDEECINDVLVSRELHAVYPDSYAYEDERLRTMEPTDGEEDLIDKE